jgi:hypothetical protein
MSTRACLTSPDLRHIGFARLTTPAVDDLELVLVDLGGAMGVGIGHATRTLVPRQHAL